MSKKALSVSCILGTSSIQRLHGLDLICPAELTLSNIGQITQIE
jgi:hypothetical protein